MKHLLQWLIVFLSAKFCFGAQAGPNYVQRLRHVQDTLLTFFEKAKTVTTQFAGTVKDLSQSGTYDISQTYLLNVEKLVRSVTLSYERVNEPGNKYADKYLIGWIVSLVIHKNLVTESTRKLKDEIDVLKEDETLRKNLRQVIEELNSVLDMGKEIDVELKKYNMGVGKGDPHIPIEVDEGEPHIPIKVSEKERTRYRNLVSEIRQKSHKKASTAGSELNDARVEDKKISIKAPVPGQNPAGSELKDARAEDKKLSIEAPVPGQNPSPLQFWQKVEKANTDPVREHKGRTINTKGNPHPGISMWEEKIKSNEKPVKKPMISIDTPKDIRVGKDEKNVGRLHVQKLDPFEAEDIGERKDHAKRHGMNKKQ